jgi:hypothetical protein
MMSRTLRTSQVLALRPGASRRISRRITARMYCATNGCASALELNPETGVATCHICGFTRRLD